MLNFAVIGFLLLWCAEVCSGVNKEYISAAAAQQRGLLIIPGLGRADRLETVVHNLRILNKHYWNELIKWDCIVYIYAPRELNSFWSQKHSLQVVRDICSIVEVPNKRVTDNLFMVQPALINQSYSRVMILLDDCKIQSYGSFNLTKILDIMVQEKLTVASPMVSFCAVL